MNGWQRGVPLHACPQQPHRCRRLNLCRQAAPAVQRRQQRESHKRHAAIGQCCYSSSLAPCGACLLLQCHALVHAAHQGLALEDALGVLLLQGQQRAGGVTDLGQNHLRAGNAARQRQWLVTAYSTSVGGEWLGVQAGRQGKKQAWQRRPLQGSSACGNTAALTTRHCCSGRCRYHPNMQLPGCL